MMRESRHTAGPRRTLGNFYIARVERMMEIVTPIFTAQRKTLKPDLMPADIATNEFLDPSIRVGP